MQRKNGRSSPSFQLNVINKKTNKPLVKPYVILNKEDVKIAVVGLTTEDTAKLGNPDVVDHVIFNNPIETAKNTLAKINQNRKTGYPYCVNPHGLLF